MQFPRKEFLKQLITSKQNVTVFLTNGVKLQGKLVAIMPKEDGEGFYLQRDGIAQAVEKHGISTIMPTQPVEMHLEGNF